MKLSFFNITFLMCGAMVCWAVSPISLRVEAPALAKTYSLRDIRKQLKAITVQTYNPAYKRDLHYEGFWLEDILETVHFPKADDAEVIFLCQDGYTALLPESSVGKHQWLLAYGESSGRWTLLDHGAEKISPAPWYLVNTNKDTFSRLPWPYRIVAIKSEKGW